MNVADDACDEGENNSADELATPRKPHKGRGVARVHAKLVMAVQNGKLRDWTRGALLHCLDVLGVKVAGNSNRRQMRDLAMQHVLPLLAQWDAFVPDTDPVMRSQHHQAAPNPVARSWWMTWMDSSMTERMVPTDLHVPFCSVVLCCLLLPFLYPSWTLSW